MCAGDDKNCPEFELHHRKFKETLDQERRSFLRSSFAAAGGAAAITAGGISLVTPQMAAAAEKNQPPNAPARPRRAVASDHKHSVKRERRERSIDARVNWAVVTWRRPRSPCLVERWKRECRRWLFSWKIILWCDALSVTCQLLC